MKIKPSLLALVVFGVVAGLAGCSPAPKPETTATAPAVPAVDTMPPPPATHAVVGKVKSVHPATKHVVVTSHDGKDHEVLIHNNAPVKEIGKDFNTIGKGFNDLAKEGKQEAVAGAHVVVHYSEDTGKKVASAVQTGSQDAMKTEKIVVSKVDEKTKTVVGKTKSGAQHTFEWTKDTTVTVGDKIADTSKGAGEELKKGTETVVHFTENEAKKVAHVFEKLDPKAKK